MIAKILVDNTAAKGFESVHGFSALIDNGEKILFDVGPNSLFLENAERMGVNMNEIETVVLSHGHWDHGDALSCMSGKRLILHPDCFTKRFRKRNNTHVGLSMTREELKLKYSLTESKDPFWINDGMVFLGEIPRENDFESKSSPFLLADGSPDFVSDDSAIAIRNKKGLIVISGCAHAGICNTIAYAKKVFSEEKVYAVLGGFHLKELDKLTERTIQFFQNEKIEIAGPTHCTSFKVRDEFKKYLHVIDLEAGKQIEL